MKISVFGEDGGGHKLEPIPANFNPNKNKFRC